MRKDGVEGSRPAEAAGARPRSLIVSFYGAYGREVGGWVAVADLIRLMAEVGVDAPAVRSSVSRLKRRGLLVARRVGDAAGYALSEEGRQILAEGDQRIYGRSVGRLADGWVLAVFSVPEHERHHRHLLRSRLTWLGFGAVAPGVWVAPAHVADEARAVVRRLGLDRYVNLFRADYLGFGDLAAMVGRWWDLAALQRGYEEFVAAYAPVLARWWEEDGGPAAAFGDYLRAVDAWRRMPYLDPGLPAELLPVDWVGARAAEVFFALHARLRPLGLDHVREVVADRRVSTPCS